MLEPTGEGHPANKSEREIKDRTEDFIPLERMSSLIRGAITDRFDENGVLLPLEQVRRDLRFIRMPLPSVMISNLILPPIKTDTNSRLEENGVPIGITYNYNTARKLYQYLTGRKDIILTTNDVNNLQKEQERLKTILEKSDEYKGEINTRQERDSFRLESKIPIPLEFAGKVRVYVPGGINAMNIVSKLIEENANFDSAKVWIPDLDEGQQAFRQDTPIIEVKTMNQLQSVLKGLNKLATNGDLVLDDKQISPIGLPIEGLPGVYLGQVKEGQSFNNKMAQLFAEPIQEVLADSPLSPGTPLSDQWIEKVAIDARKIAYEAAEKKNVNPLCHALLPNQDPTPIINAINTVREYYGKT